MKSVSIPLNDGWIEWIDEALPIIRSFGLPGHEIVTGIQTDLDALRPKREKSIIFDFSDGSTIEMDWDIRKTEPHFQSLLRQFEKDELIYHADRNNLFLWMKSNISNEAINRVRFDEKIWSQITNITGKSPNTLLLFETLQSATQRLTKNSVNQLVIRLGNFKQVDPSGVRLNFPTFVTKFENRILQLESLNHYFDNQTKSSMLMNNVDQIHFESPLIELNSKPSKLKHYQKVKDHLLNWDNAKALTDSSTDVQAHVNVASTVNRKRDRTQESTQSKRSRIDKSSTGGNSSGRSTETA
jgi:hypothetical protein